MEPGRKRVCFCPALAPSPSTPFPSRSLALSIRKRAPNPFSSPPSISPLRPLRSLLSLRELIANARSLWPFFVAC